MKRNIILLLLALGCGAGLLVWTQHPTADNHQVKGIKTAAGVNQPDELGLVWVRVAANGGRVVTADAGRPARTLTDESDDVFLACRINDASLAYVTRRNGFNTLWLWTTAVPAGKFIAATKQTPVELSCDPMGNSVLYAVNAGDGRRLYRVDLASGATSLVDTVAGRPAIDQTGQRLIYPKADGLYYREVNRSAELTEPLRLVAGSVSAAVFTRSSNVLVYVLKEADGYSLYRTDWRSQTTEVLHRFDIGVNDLRWSLELSGDGETILYRYSPEPSDWHSTVGLIGLDGSGQLDLQTDLGRAAWMPHDRLIVYEKLGLASDAVTVSLWQMTRTGGDREVIADSGRDFLSGDQIPELTAGLSV